MIKNLAILLLIGLAVQTNTLSPSDFEITEMPGYSETVPFKQYSGFLESTAGNYIFFWFVESQNDPSTDPVAYWTNGGPGASGIQYGLFTEYGPWQVNPDGKTVSLYEYSWNKVSSVIFVEQPCGVGFSYSEDPSHYNTDDKQAANDIYYFFINFFNVFTEFENNDFYVTSESWGGHYVPTTMNRILQGRNTTEGAKLFAHTKGFLIGNPAIDQDENYNGAGLFDIGDVLRYYYYHLIPVHAYAKVEKECDLGAYYSSCSKIYPGSDECKKAIKTALAYNPKDMDFQNVLCMQCPQDASVNHVYAIPWNAKYDSCINNYAPSWMNSEAVQKATHADNHTNANWPDNNKNFNYGGNNPNCVGLFPTFKKEAPHWNMEIVSGTADANCPTTMTDRWVNCLGYQVTQDFQAWSLDSRVAGATIQYDGLTFTTVEGCGHTLGTYCPAPGLAMWKNFLARTQKSIVE